MFQNLDQLKTWQALYDFAKNQSSSMNIDDSILDSKQLLQNDYLSFIYSLSGVTPKLLSLFQALVEETKCLKQFKALLAGQRINLSENRSVSHHNYRKLNTKENEGLRYLKQVCEKYRHSDIKHIIHIGIGGSELAPKALYYALRSSFQNEIPIDFVSNLDPIFLEEILRKICLKNTLFILVSKSGTTQETLSNYEYIQAFYEKQNLKKELQGNTIIITGESSKLSILSGYKHIIEVPLSIGGRFSLLSPYSLFSLGLSLGPEIIERCIKGASKMDQEVLNPDLKDNMALLAACISTWQTCFLGLPVSAIIPYSSQLQHFGFYLQQLICESLGKDKNQYNEAIHYPTGSLIVTFPGTNAQHSFFQLLHQGTQICPTQFIFTKDITSHISNHKAHETHQLLNLNGLAQMTALAQGNQANFPGGRPVTAISIPSLSPESMGALVAFYENMVIFKGFLLNINSFDQPGVELGKQLVKEHLKDPEKNQLLKHLNKDLFHN